jgi:hypothetical protein
VRAEIEETARLIRERCNLNITQGRALCGPAEIEFARADLPGVCGLACPGAVRGKEEKRRLLQQAVGHGDPLLVRSQRHLAPDCFIFAASCRCALTCCVHFCRRFRGACSMSCCPTCE